jgi:nitric-oxide synthase
MFHHRHGYYSWQGVRDMTSFETVTSADLADTARVAWRNADRCIGRAYWRSLSVRDRRDVVDPRAIAAEMTEHLRLATNNGNIRPVATVLHPSVRILNEQLIGYAGYPLPDGTVLGDGRNRQVTETALSLGWPGGRRTSAGYSVRGRFDVLPLMISVGGSTPTLHELPSDAAREVPISHPEQPWFIDLGLRWYAVSAATDMRLWLDRRVSYPIVFGGWWLATGIASRELADPDRYDMLPAIATGFGLDVTTLRSLWPDRAEHELLRAILHSYDSAGVRISDHHAESKHFLTFVDSEHKAGRVVRSDWSWIVPTQAAARLGVYHTYQEPPDPSTIPAIRRTAPEPPRSALCAY